jgi:lactoylglutathione lyase
MILVKHAIDVGIQLRCAEVGERTAVLSHWQGLGARPDHVLPLGGGRRQHRHAWGESVLKLNELRGGAPEGPASGWGPLRLIGPDAGPATGDRDRDRDPEGNRVRSEPGERTGLVIGLRVRDAGASAAFFAALGLDARGHRVRVGDCAIEIRTDAEAPVDPPMEGTGYRYITLQVDAVDRAHAEALAAGGREGMAPTTLGEVARISFVLEPGGNWIELSQRRSLTGSLEAG